jgi:hypothetical protein
MKINIKILMLTLLTACCLNTAGCASFPKHYNTEATPIYPELGSTIMKHYEVIDTLQPELKWKDIKTEGQTYDVCVWETKRQDSGEFMRGVPYVPKSWGDQVFYVEGISQNYVKINKPLKPDTYYHWSVRTRKGKDTADWATFNQSMISILVYGRVDHVPYGFVTPKQ